MRKPNAVLIVLGCSFLCGSARAQLVSVGAKGSVALFDPAPNFQQSKWFSVGASVEFRLPFRFAAEVDALYTRTGFNYAFNFANPDGSSVNSVVGSRHSNQWDFPVIGKYYFSSQQKKVQPFVGTGYAFRANWSHDDSNTTILSGTNLTQFYTNSFSSRQPTQVGAVFSAGVRIHAGRLAILPELRYTRWSTSTNGSRKNDARFLLGVSF